MAVGDDGKSYEAKPEGTLYVGVVKNTRAFTDGVIAVMDMGVVETKALHIPYSAEMLEEMSSTLKIVFRQ